MTAQTVFPATTYPPRIAPRPPPAPTVPGRSVPLTGDARPVLLAHLIDTFGTGLVLTGVPVFLVRSAGLTVGQIAVAVTVAGSVALALSMPIGILADRWGPRDVAVLMFAVRALAVLSFLAVESVAALFLAASAALTAERGGQVSLRTLTALAGAGQRVRLREHLHSVTVFGLPAGAALAGVLLVEDSRRAGVAVVATCSVVAGAAGAVLSRVSRYRTPPAPVGPGRVPPRGDLPFLAVAVLHAMLNLATEVSSFALPLWVATRTGTPGWTVAVVIVLDAALVASFPVPVGRGLAVATRAAVAGRRRGSAVLAAAVLIAFSGPGYPRRMAGLLFAAAIVLTAGECWPAVSPLALGPV